MFSLDPSPRSIRRYQRRQDWTALYAILVNDTNVILSDQPKSRAAIETKFHTENNEPVREVETIILRYRDNQITFESLDGDNLPAEVYEKKYYLTNLLHCLNFNHL